MGPGATEGKAARTHPPWSGTRYRMPSRRGGTTLPRVRRLVYALIGVGLVAIIVIGLTQSKGGSAPNPKDIKSRAPSAAQVERAFAGSPAPLADLHGRANEIIPGGRDELQRQIRALRGHPVVVNVWGSWCGPCRLEFPSFQQSAVRYGRQVAFLGVDARDNRGEAKGFLRDFPVTYPSVEDPDESVLGKLGGRGYPSTAYYDRNGKMLFLHQGPYRTDADLNAHIRRFAGVGYPPLPEIRVDPLSGLRTIVAGERATRPGAGVSATPP